MTGDGGLVEVQATAERTPLSRAHLDELLALAAARHRAAARRAGAGDRRGRRALTASAAPRAGHAQRAQACASSRACSAAARACVPLPDGVDAAAGGRRDVRRERARQGARGGGGDRRGGDRRRLGHRGGGARRRARACARRATRASTRPTRENLAKLLREAPGGQRAGLRLRDRLRRPGAAREQRLRGPLRGHAGRRAARRAAASAMTRCSCPTTAATGRTMAELSDEREGRDQPPRRAARARGWLRRGATAQSRLIAAETRRRAASTAGVAVVAARAARQGRQQRRRARSRARRSGRGSSRALWPMRETARRGAVRTPPVCGAAVSETAGDRVFGAEPVRNRC